MRPHLLSAAAALLVAGPLPLVAQARYAIGAYVARNDALPDRPNFGGLAFTVYARPLALRATGGLNFRDRAESEPTGTCPCIGAWTADVDLLLVPASSGSYDRTRLPIEPFLFLGIGANGVRGPEELDESIGLWSYGLGVALPLGSSARLETDARRRASLSAGAPSLDGFRRNWEYRLGISFAFGREGRAADQEVRPRRGRRGRR